MKKRLTWMRLTLGSLALTVQCVYAADLIITPTTVTGDGIVSALDDDPLTVRLEGTWTNACPPTTVAVEYSDAAIFNPFPFGGVVNAGSVSETGRQTLEGPDLDNDGVVDIITVRRVADVDANGNPDIRVLQDSDGDGIFTVANAGQVLDADGDGIADTLVIDVNGDGARDDIDSDGNGLSDGIDYDQNGEIDTDPVIVGGTLVVEGNRRNDLDNDGVIDVQFTINSVVDADGNLDILSVEATRNDAFIDVDGDGADDSVSNGDSVVLINLDGDEALETVTFVGNAAFIIDFNGDGFRDDRNSTTSPASLTDLVADGVDLNLNGIIDTAPVRLGGVQLVEQRTENDLDRDGRADTRLELFQRDTFIDVDGDGDDDSVDIDNDGVYDFIDFNDDGIRDDIDRDSFNEDGELQEGQPDGISDAIDLNGDGSADAVALFPGALNSPPASFCDDFPGLPACICRADYFGTGALTRRIQAVDPSCLCDLDLSNNEVDPETGEILLDGLECDEPDQNTVDDLIGVNAILLNTSNPNTNDLASCPDTRPQRYSVQAELGELARGYYTFDIIHRYRFGFEELTNDFVIANAQFAPLIFNVDSDNQYLLTGQAQGMAASKVICRNQTTGQTVETVAGEAGWSCTDAGLEVAPGDRVLQSVIGTATP